MCEHEGHGPECGNVCHLGLEYQARHTELVMAGRHDDAMLLREHGIWL